MCCFAKECKCSESHMANKCFLSFWLLLQHLVDQGPQTQIAPRAK